jgi:membrane fusion protein (multidrug efflux system)
VHLPRRTPIWLWLALSTPVLAGCHDDVPVEETAIPVEAGEPRVRDVEVTLRYPIEVEADETVQITPVAISGFLRKVFVDVGDKVKAGQLIAVVDCREYSAQKTQAATAIAKWDAQVDESRTRLERLVAMGEGKHVAPAEVDRARAEARIAEAELADARAKLSEASQRQGYCSLTSPFPGYVSERLLDPGAMVTPGGTPVVNIVKTRDVTVVASVVEHDAPKVKPGTEVDVVLHAFPETSFRAEVARVGRSLDPKTRTLRVEMNVPNRTEDLLPGMTGRAAIVVGKREDALLVPVTAVLKLEEAAFLYVIHEDEAGRARTHRVEVEVGEDYGDWLEITDGIAADDRVVVVGRELVDEGTWVEVVEAVNRPRASPAPERATPEPRQPEIEADTDDGTAEKEDHPHPVVDVRSESGDEQPADDAEADEEKKEAAERPRRRKGKRSRDRATPTPADDAKADDEQDKGPPDTTPP